MTTKVFFHGFTNHDKSSGQSQVHSSCVHIPRIVKLPSGKQPQNYGTSPFLLGKLTNSMAVFNGKVLGITKLGTPVVSHVEIPMKFPWNSHEICRSKHATFKPPQRPQLPAGRGARDHLLHCLMRILEFEPWKMWLWTMKNGSLYMFIPVNIGGSPWSPCVFLDFLGLFHHSNVKWW